LSYEELYRLAYRVVLQKKGEILYNRVRDFENDWLEGTVRPKILDYLTGSLVSPASAAVNVSERRAAGERFLKGLKAEWLDHKLCMAMLSDVLMYMVCAALCRLIAGTEY
jgi:cullin 3